MLKERCEQFKNILKTSSDPETLNKYFLIENDLLGGYPELN